MSIKFPLAAFLSLAAWALSAATARASLILPGPSLTGNTIAWENAGLQFTALRPARLERFTFENQGYADLVHLTDAQGNILDTYPVPAGHQALLIETDWLLQPGATYQLIAELPDNGRWADYRNFPTANDDLRVNGVVGRGTLEKVFWFNFTHLTTTALVESPAAPEPSPLPLLLLFTPYLLRRRPSLPAQSAHK